MSTLITVAAGVYVLTVLGVTLTLTLNGRFAKRVQPLRTLIYIISGCLAGGLAIANWWQLNDPLGGTCWALCSFFMFRTAKPQSPRP